MKAADARKILLCMLAAGAVGMAWGPLRAQEQTDRAEAPRERVMVTLFDQRVQLPSRDPRRVTLPAVHPGTVILVEALPSQDEAGLPPGALQIEILRRETAADSPAASALESVYLFHGSPDGPLRYRVTRAGQYLVAVRQAGTGAADAAIRLRVRMERAPSRPPRPAPRTLPEDTRIAVGVFSAGLLWTTLLLCGVPIIRAFRSRRRSGGPPWSA